MAVIRPIHKYYFEILFVDDGSRDNTIGEIQKLIEKKMPVGFVQLSRNFGHQYALEAGFATADADAIITMDGDLQHPPEEIIRMIEKFEEGADVVQMQRKNVSEDFKGKLSVSFYTFFKWISDTPIVPNAADFRLVSRRVAEEIMKMPGKGKFLRALIPTIGFTQIHLEYKQDQRKFGKPSYSFFDSYELALHTIFKFSRFPAHFTFFTGLIMLISGAIFSALLLGSIIPPSAHIFFVCLFLLLGGCIFLATGIICWYLFFILEQARQDPPFVVKEIVYPPVKFN